jgi:hypothetical protein
MPIRNDYDREKLSRVLSQQFGVVGRNQALASGLSKGAIDRLVQPGGRWQKIVPGVYATTTGTVDPDQRAMAALLHAGPQSVITGATAVRRHRLRCAGLNEVDVLVPKGIRVQSTRFIRVIHTARMPEGVFATGQIRFAPLPRAVADAARSMSRLSDVRAVVAESVQRGRCELSALVGELHDGPTAGSRFYRIALAEIGEGIRSAAEADLKVLIEGSDLEKPMYNAALFAADGRFLGVADAWWARAGVAAEVDSRQYHLGPEDHERTTHRHNMMSQYSIVVLHFLPNTLTQDATGILVQLRGALTAGHARPRLTVTAVPASSLASLPRLGSNAQMHPIGAGRMR